MDSVPDMTSLHEAITRAGMVIIPDHTWESRVHTPPELRPQALFYDDARYVAMFRYCHQPLSQIERIYGQEHRLDFTTGGYERLYPISAHYENLKPRFGEEIALTMMNILFHINPAFRAFHHYGSSILSDDINRLYACSILSVVEHASAVQYAIDILARCAKIDNLYKKGVSLQLTGITCFALDINMFYHLTNANHVAYRLGYLDRLPLRVGTLQREVRGKVDYEWRDDKLQNPFYPD